jgi:hypothetical protein
MNAEPKERKRHPSTLIPLETVQELAYRTWLLRLEPPMTPEQSRAKTVERSGVIVASDEKRRAASRAYVPLLRDALQAAVDIGLVMLPGGNDAA